MNIQWRLCPKYQAWIGEMIDEFPAAIDLHGKNIVPQIGSMIRNGGRIYKVADIIHDEDRKDILVIAREI